MLNNLLAAGTENIIMFVIIGVFIAVLIVFYFISNKRRKKQEQDAKDLINAVGPGNKVKTIGGICGIVVEVDDEENTFVLETGTETSGKSYIKFDKQAIYQTDAVVENKDEKAKTEEKVEEPVEEKTEESAEPVVTAEEAEKPEMVKKKKSKKDEEEKQVKF